MSPNKKFPALAAGAALLIAGAVFLFATRAPADPVPMTVYMTPQCVCCGEWVAYMKKNGFLVTARYMSAEDLGRLKDRHGIPHAARSCHTAEAKVYVVEGHTPADVVRRILEDRPELTGVAVPGMPVGSPGMEVPGRRPDPYNVLAFDRGGDLSVMERR